MRDPFLKRVKQTQRIFDAGRPDPTFTYMTYIKRKTKKKVEDQEEEKEENFPQFALRNNQTNLMRDS